MFCKFWAAKDYYFKLILERSSQVAFNPHEAYVYPATPTSKFIMKRPSTEQAKAISRANFFFSLPISLSYIPRKNCKISNNGEIIQQFLYAWIHLRILEYP